MALAEETHWLDATAQAELVRAGEVTPVELVGAAIERIHADDQAEQPLNGVTSRWFDDAQSEAASDLPDGPFRGVPFLVKDLGVHIKGRPLSNGNAALFREGPPSTFDSDLATRYRAAGLVTLGRTASPEFGSLPVAESTAYGPTRNPWNRDRNPGGSSGGSGAAVAAGLVPIAHGSDGGGSIRIPASCCGLFGLKPTQGRITMGPDRTETSVGVDHVLTRSVRDSAAMLDATHGPGVGDIIWAPAPERPYIDEVGADPGQLRIGLVDTLPRGGILDPELVEAVANAAHLLESLGHHVEHGYPEPLADETVPGLFGAVRAPNMAAMIDGVAATLGRELEPGDVSGINLVQAEFGRAITAVQLVGYVAEVAKVRRRVHAWWAEGWDLLLSPTLGEVPMPVGTIDPDGEDAVAHLMRAGDFVPFTPLFNTSGQPAVSLPLHWTADGLPVGVQLVAAYGREDLLLRVSSQLEQAQPWADRRPDL